MDKSRVEPSIFFIEKIKFSLKLFSANFYGQSFIKTVRGPCGSKIEGRHISDVICTSDSMYSCMAPGFWQTLISIVEVRDGYCSEIESCKSKPMDQKFHLFCVETRHSP